MSEKKINRITWALILLSLVMIIAGVFRGESIAVANKAVKVCMQCIGIG